MDLGMPDHGLQGSSGIIGRKSMPGWRFGYTRSTAAVNSRPTLCAFLTSGFTNLKFSGIRLISGEIEEPEW